MPISVGITGGIGVGKTVVTKVFSTLGIPVYDADSRAKILLNSDPELVQSITKEFGENSYKSGELNRRYLAETVFNNSDRVEVLNSLVHPRVALDFENWRTQHKDKAYLIKEAALLVESGSYKELDQMIVVDSSDELRMARILKRDPERSVDEVKAIMSKQIPQAEKLQLADFVIDNNGKIPLIKQVVDIDRKIKRMLNSTLSGQWPEAQ